MEMEKIYYAEDMSAVLKKIKKEIDTLPTSTVGHLLASGRECDVVYETIDVEKKEVFKIIDKYIKKWGSRDDKETVKREE